jgi:hypothetical protein
MYQKMINPYQNKVIELHSFRKIDNFVDSL